MQFKEYVNTLALIRQEDSEKYLVLKPIFYPAGYTSGYSINERSIDVNPIPPPLAGHSHQHTPPPSYPPVGLPPPQPHYAQPPYGQPQYGQPQYGQSAPAMDAPAFRAPPPYRPPPEPVPFRRSSSVSLAGSDPSNSPVNTFPPPAPSYHHPPIPPPSVPAPPQFLRQSSLPTDDFIPASAYLLPMPERSVSIQDFTQTSSTQLVQDLTGSPAPAIPPRRLKSQRGDDKENQLVKKNLK